MKNWNEHGDALVASRRAPIGTRFLTAAFAALVVIAGLDTISPSFKFQLIPEQGSPAPIGPIRPAQPFDWSQVRVEHSSSTSKWGAVQ